jgi:methionyl aminopeptidase
MNQKEIDKIIKAGEIAKQVVQYAKSIIKPDMPLLEIANLVDDKILQLKAKPAFPINLSINEIAAHSTPSFNDETKAHGLLKVDIGVHIDGFVADTAFSLDLENSNENQNLIKAAETARDNALDLIQLNSKLKDIGNIIEQTCKQLNVLPINNLSGHSIDLYDLHSGITIPNFNNHQELQLQEGLYAVEPFTTLSSGTGAVRDGKPSGIYHLENQGNVRDPFARKVLEYIKEEFQTLPFSARQIHKQFNTRGLLALRQIESVGLLHHYAQLIEKSGKKVAQAEHTILLTKDKKIITTK